MAYHRPWEPCKSQFTVQTPPNSCREKQVCNIVSMQWLIVPQERQICKNESALSWWALSNAITAEYEMKFHFRWHQIERSGEKKVASPTLPLTISSVESNQGGMRLKFLSLFRPSTLAYILASYHLLSSSSASFLMWRQLSSVAHLLHVERRRGEEDKEMEQFIWWFPL